MPNVKIHKSYDKNSYYQNLKLGNIPLLVLVRAKQDWIVIAKIALTAEKVFPILKDRDS